MEDHATPNRCAATAALQITEVIATPESTKDISYSATSPLSIGSTAAPQEASIPSLPLPSSPLTLRKASPSTPQEVFVPLPFPSRSKATILMGTNRASEVLIRFFRRSAAKLKGIRNQRDRHRWLRANDRLVCGAAERAQTLNSAPRELVSWSYFSAPYYPHGSDPLRKWMVVVERNFRRHRVKFLEMVRRLVCVKAARMRRSRILAVLGTVVTDEAAHRIGVELEALEQSERMGNRFIVETQFKAHVDIMRDHQRSKKLVLGLLSVSQEERDNRLANLETPLVNFWLEVFGLQQQMFSAIERHHRHIIEISTAAQESRLRADHLVHLGLILKSEMVHVLSLQIAAMLSGGQWLSGNDAAQGDTPPKTVEELQCALRTLAEKADFAFARVRVEEDFSRDDILGNFARITLRAHLHEMTLQDSLTQKERLTRSRLVQQMLRGPPVRSIQIATRPKFSVKQLIEEKLEQCELQEHVALAPRAPQQLEGPSRLNSAAGRNPRVGSAIPRVSSRRVSPPRCAPAPLHVGKDGFNSGMSPRLSAAIVGHRTKRMAAGPSGTRLNPHSSEV